jgi:2-dehydro-3-deoxyphosphogluconate aldolase / (4S)-4-hydroxy-2-oxoglutarate aldolase
MTRPMSEEAAPQDGECQFNLTGGVSEANLKGYLALPNVVAAGGSWLAPAAEVAAGHWDAVAARAAKATAILRQSGEGGT